MFKKLCIVLGFIFIPTFVFSNTAWVVVPSKASGGSAKWGWTWGKYMNKNIPSDLSISKIDFKYVPGKGGRKALIEFEKKLKFDSSNILLGNGSTATSYLFSYIGGYDFRNYTPIVIHPGNMFLPIHKSFDPLVDKNVQAINGNGGSEPEHFASGIMLCPDTLNNIDKFLSCFKEKINIVRGVSSKERHIMFLNKELSVGRISANGWLGNKLYKKHKDKLRIWFHHCQMNFKTGKWEDDPQKTFQGLCFDDVFEQTHGFRPSGNVYDAYVLTRLWRDSFQKTLWAPKNNKNINDLIKIAELTMQDKSFEKERFKKLGKYSVYIGAEGNFIIKEAYKALTKENLSIAIKFVNEGLGMKSSLKKELIN